MIVVSGASRGLGRAIALRLQQQGREVLGIARSADDSGVRVLACDVADPVAVRGLATELRSQGAQVEALVNAAGVASMNLTVMTPAATAASIVNTNLLGTIYMCQAFAPLMMRGKQGRIVNFSTIAVALALKGEAIYAASKAGVEAFTRAFAREVADFSITVNCVAPGPIPTDLLRGVGDAQVAEIVKRQIQPRVFSAEDVCDMVELLLDPRSAGLTGHVLHLGGV
jgi:3-oxoacyl-[acyl-carrier protein] reductase